MFQCFRCFAFQCFSPWCGGGVGQGARRFPGYPCFHRFQVFAVFSVFSFLTVFRRFTVFSIFTALAAFAHFGVFSRHARIRRPAPGAARGWTGEDIGPNHHEAIARPAEAGVNRRDVATTLQQCCTGPARRMGRSCACRRRAAASPAFGSLGGSSGTLHILQWQRRPPAAVRPITRAGQLFSAPSLPVSSEIVPRVSAGLSNGVGANRSRIEDGPHMGD